MEIIFYAIIKAAATVFFGKQALNVVKNHHRAQRVGRRF